MAGDSRWGSEEAEETGEKVKVDEEDMLLIRFLHLYWRTWPSSVFLHQKAAGAMEPRKTPENTETYI